MITRVECEGAGGLYNGDGTACGGNICQIGACCVGIECSLVREAVCETLGGRFHGVGVPCEAIDCTVGACCIEGACFEKSPEDCASSGGVYQGIGTFCGFGQCVNTPCGTGVASGVARNEAASIGLGQGALQLDPLTGSCGTLLLNTDSSYENGYSWQYGGVAPPYYGAFAECFGVTNAQICSAVFDLTQAGLDGGRMDIYVWEDEDGCPGNVLCGPKRVIPGTIAFWPNVSRHEFTLDGCCSESAVWVGYWGAWPGQLSPFYVGADLNGPGGCPKTCIAPGFGYPSGWNNVSVVFGPTRALGIGCETVPCTPPVAIEKMSWGRVKSLYDGAVRRVPATR